LISHRKRLLNILFVADVSIQNVIGGAERVLHEQSTRLVQRGHNIHILTRRLPGHDTEYECISDVGEWRYDCNYNNQLLFLHSIIKNAKLLFEKLHNKFHFDFINFHQPFSSFGVIQSPAMNWVPKLYTCHSFSFEEFITRNNGQNGLLELTYNLLNICTRRWIEKKVLANSDKITVLSNFTKKKLIDKYKIPADKVSVIHGGVDLNRFKLSKKRALIRKAIGIPDNKIVILTVRNLVNRMGLDNLIYALNNIVNSAPDIYLVIVGDGPLKPNLIVLTNNLGLNDFIHFAGFAPEDKLPTYYQMADLFVLPTKELEGFGLVTLEALASGLPVLGTPIGGTKEILGRFDPDFIFENTRPESISKKIIEKYRIIKENPLKWKEISHRCRNFIEHNFSWEKNVESLENLFANKLNK
jgi:glycosyltransferase involved in cell wall biosynthesis